MSKLLNEVKMYDDLLEHIGWRRLRERISEQRASFMSSLAKRMMTGEEVPRKEIDFYRGYYAGARDLIERPAHAHLDLEEKARRAWLEAEVVLTHQNSQEESPYA